MATLLTGVKAMAVDRAGATIAVGSDEAVKVFRTTDGWDTHTEIEITAADGEAYDYFGEAVAIDGTTVVVGAYRTYYKGKKGAAYVFRLTDDGYEEVATLTARRRGGRLLWLLRGGRRRQHRGGCQGCRQQQWRGLRLLHEGRRGHAAADKLMGQYGCGTAVAMDGGSFVVGAPGGYNRDTGSATIFGPRR